MDNAESFQAVVRGRVQGVNFRAFVRQRAKELNIRGFVRNLPGGNELEVQAEGDKKSLEKLTDYIKTGPEGASVSQITIHWSKSPAKFDRFDILY
jgi:acylphosphatase